MKWTEKNFVVIALSCALCTALSFALAGCPKTPLEQSALDVIAAAGGSISQMQTDHQVECVANPKLSLCQKIDQAVAAQNTLIDVTATYCGWTVRPISPSTAPCARLASAIPAMQVAVTNLSAIIADAKAAAGVAQGVTK